MEDYNEDYVAHNLPLLVLSGLPQPEHERSSSPGASSTAGNGARLASDIPLLSGPIADQLLDGFLKTDGASQAWSEYAQSDRGPLIGFKITSTGRSFSFPLRKAVPPPIAPDLTNPQNSAVTPSAGLELHSSLSPLSPTAPIFPDGIMTPLWLAKHQNHVPSVFLSFYSITSDHSQSTLRDNQIKNDINALRDVLARSGYRTRFAVVLVADKRAPSLEMEDRIAGIRRATALDPKNGLFFTPSPASQEELMSFVISVMSALQPICIDYYRDLTKHTRRKKARGYVPPPTASVRGTSQSLTLHGWNVRYDFKLAVFAEFRQEMDVAQRHYESALEELFGPEGDLEMTASWSPRWEDCRVLCDIIAFRILRCQIWRGMTVSASESWCNYRYRMKDLVDRRGKGTDGYGWEAWEARWAKMMAQLIEMAELPVFKTVDLSDALDTSQVANNATYAPPEKAYSAMDRILPFHYLHHPGYWWRLVSKHILARRRKAEAIPAEDRTPLSQVSAAQAASRARTYDTYLVPQPHEEAPQEGHATYDYLLDVQSQTERAESEFAKRGQIRTVQHVRLDFARELVRAERYGEALDLLRPVWNEMSWRREGWMDSAKEVLQLIHGCAVKVDDRSLVVEVVWEMACQAFSSPSQESIDILQSLERLGERNQAAFLSINSKTRLSPVSLKFAFLSSEGFVGDTAAAQIVITFDSIDQAKPIFLSEVRIHFGNNFRSLNVSHAESEDKTFSVLDNLREDHDPSHPMAKTLHSHADLRLRPGQTRVFDISIPLREADNFHATGASIMLGGKDATLEYVYAQPADIRGEHWLLRSADKITKSVILRAEQSSTTVLPKPPKMQIKILNPRDQYFTSERIILEIEIANEEDDETSVRLQSSVEDEEGAPLDISWVTTEDQTAQTDDISSLEVGKLSASECTTRQIVLQPPSDPSVHTLSITALYRLTSSADSEIPLSKTLTLDIAFVSPFEANYDFGPRLHPDGYPNFFLLPETSLNNSTDMERKPEGIEQKWCLTSRVASFASETLIVESTSVVVNKVTSNSICVPEQEDGDDDDASKPITVQNRGMINVVHIVKTRKYSLEDRRVSALDLSLSIKWRRQDDPTGQTTTTLLAVPNLAIPHAEPRVLCTVEPSPQDNDTDDDEGVDRRVLHYTIENPSMHFLNFTLTMEASDEFAFSGPKFRAVSLTPMSRTRVEYNILIYDRRDQGGETVVVDEQRGRGRWISPALRVMDPYFNRSLRVLDGGEGVVSDERGNVGIWIAEK